MPRLPLLAGTPAQRITTDTFLGYNHNLKIGNGEFYDTENLTTEQYPMLANRRKRGTLDQSFTKLQGIIAKQDLYYVDNGKLYERNDPTRALLEGLQTEKETFLVGMGTYICIFPDKMYLNTLDTSDKGSMEASWEYTGRVYYSMCHQDGTPYERVSKGASAPEEPNDGDVWVDSSGRFYEPKVWSSAAATWTVIETVYTRIEFTTIGQIPKAFKVYDGVEIEGIGMSDFNSALYKLNGSKILYAVGGSEGEVIYGGEDILTENDFITIIGFIDQNTEEENATVRISRRVPDMDFVCEAQNRLWGCYYNNIPILGNVNELYCCALGDFKNWSQFLGLSTDSWRASVGSDGRWTGCINYLGSPTFFKENRIHQISVSSVGAHQVNDLPARGVQIGSHRSLAIVNETLYYKTRSGVVAWQGGIPADVGAALGDVRYYEATAGVFGSRYYLSMRTNERITAKTDTDAIQIRDSAGDKWHIPSGTGSSTDISIESQSGKSWHIAAGEGSAGDITVTDDSDEEWYIPSGEAETEDLGWEWHLFVYDVKTGLWMREDDLHAEGFAAWGDELYARVGNEIVTINGTEGALEDKIHWFAETGVLYYEFADHKYVSRYNLRLKMERGARLQLYIEYDSSGEWIFSGEIKVRNLDSFVVPVRPRRCDHMRLKLVGEGDVKIFSLVRVLEGGSDR